MSRAKRLWLFASDLVAELPSVWAVARHNDCGRNGGHRWGDVTHDNVMRSWGATCSRCRRWRSVPFATTPTTGSTDRVYTFQSSNVQTFP